MAIADKARRDERAKEAPLTETDLASDIMGDNSLAGDDQENVRNERHAVPDPRQRADADPVESAHRLDKEERARAELDKGARSAGGERSDDDAGGDRT